jgi:hypothetical protein
MQSSFLKLVKINKNSKPLHNFKSFDRTFVNHPPRQYFISKPCLSITPTFLKIQQRAHFSTENLSLSKTKCIPCEGNVPALTKEESAKYLQQLDQWKLSDDSKVNRALAVIKDHLILILITYRKYRRHTRWNTLEQEWIS